MDDRKKKELQLNAYRIRKTALQAIQPAGSGHVEIHAPGADMSAGSLGQGLSAAFGMALCEKKQ